MLKIIFDWKLLVEIIFSCYVSKMNLIERKFPHELNFTKKRDENSR